MHRIEDLRLIYWPDNELSQWLIAQICEQIILSQFTGDKDRAFFLGIELLLPELEGRLRQTLENSEWFRINEEEFLEQFNKANVKFQKNFNDTKASESIITSVNFFLNKIRRLNTRIVKGFFDDFIMYQKAYTILREHHLWFFVYEYFGIQYRRLENHKTFTAYKQIVPSFLNMSQTQAVASGRGFCFGMILFTQAESIETVSQLFTNCRWSNDSMAIVRLNLSNCTDFSLFSEILNRAYIDDPV